jgi:two-component system, NarL family, response regulator DevR
LERLGDAVSPESTTIGADGARARHARLVAEGLTNRQVAEHLFMAEKTVKNYVSGLLASWTLASWIWSDALKRQIYGAQVRQEQARHEGT